MPKKYEIPLKFVDYMMQQILPVADRLVFHDEIIGKILCVGKKPDYAKFLKR